MGLGNVWRLVVGVPRQMTTIGYIALIYGICIAALLYTGHPLIALALVVAAILLFVGACFGFWIVLTREGKPL